MAKAQYAILRFSKYKGPEISRLEAHNERTKEKYASNPDVDTSRSTLNFHLIQPEHSYREEAERQIAEAGCRVRSDSVKLVEVLIAGTPSFFKDKTQEQIKEYFEHALEFLRQKQRAETFVSAVVHLDEKTPHMHVTFVPLTEDNRLSAKKIIGNKAKLSQWQSDYWTHMVGKYPDLERGELDTAKRGSVQKKLDDAQLLNDYLELCRIVERIPPEILERAKRQERSAAASRCTR